MGMWVKKADFHTKIDNAVKDIKNKFHQVIDGRMTNPSAEHVGVGQNDGLG